MSLINDALKRATASEPKKDATGHSAPPLEPVHDGERRGLPGVLPLVLCIVGLGALLTAGGFWLKSKGTPHPAPTSGTEGANTGALTPARAGATEPAATTPAPSTPLNNPLARAAATLEQVQNRNEEVPTTQTAAPAETPGSSSASSSSPSQAAPVQQASTPAAAPAPTPATAEMASNEANPPFKLQAIYYRLRGPSVVVNGKTVKAGQSVDGAKVVSIQRNSVELEFHGTNFSLALP
jgi:hypothetical protein